jgi:hypothetical protein
MQQQQQQQQEKEEQQQQQQQEALEGMQQQQQQEEEEQQLQQQEEVLVKERQVVSMRADHRGMMGRADASACAEEPPTITNESTIFSASFPGTMHGGDAAGNFTGTMHVPDWEVGESSIGDIPTEVAAYITPPVVSNSNPQSKAGSPDKQEDENELHESAAAGGAAIVAATVAATVATATSAATAAARPVRNLAGFV